MKSVLRIVNFFAKILKLIHFKIWKC